MEMDGRCRICLGQAESSVDIFVNFLGENKSYTYAESIRHIAKVEVQLDDGLPQTVCYECCAELENIFKFGLLIRHGDEILRKQLAETLQPLSNDGNIRELGVGEEFMQTEDVDMQMCVLEDEEETIVEDYVGEDHQDELQMVEEILDVDDDDVVPLKQQFHNESAGNIIKNDPLEELAQVAATQQNVLVVDHQQFYHQQQQHDSSSCYPEDECDDNYLIPYDPAEEPYYHFKPPKWKCMECKQVLRGDVSYDGHMNIHKKLRPYKCADCHREFRCRKALRDHKKIRHIKTSTIIEKPQYQEVGEETNYESNSFQCTDCGEECQSREECLLHYLLVHDNRSNVKTCPFCPNDKVDNLIEHLQLVHVVVSNPKPVNGEELLTPASTLWHCDNCTETFTSAEDLDYHRKMCGISIEEDDEAATIDNGAEQFLESVDAIVYCRVCKKKLLKKNLKRHMTLHERNKDKNSVDDNTRFLCSYCPREFKYSKSLHQHEKTHQGESADTVYVCVDCDRQYTSQFLLEIHRKQAHKERDHVCSICGNAFKLKSQLVDHMKLHLEKNIPCPHCEKKYARQFDLNVHLRSHTGEMPYACHLCSKRFAIKVRLTYHLQKHYGIKHQCKECHAEFNSKQKLKAHSFKHTGMPYRCELCDDHGFSTRVVFKRHLNRVHQATMSDEALNEMFQRNTGKTIKIKQIVTEKPDDVK